MPALSALVLAGRVIERRGLIMDPERFETCWTGRRVHLSPLQFLMVSALARRPGYIRTRNDLLDAIGDQGQRVDRTVDSQIKRIRQEFKAVDPDFDEIETVYGMGWRWRDDL